MPISAQDLRRELVALDKQHVWHPYTEMSAWLETAEPLVIARAEGSRLYDLDGRHYLDANASWWTSLLGHGHPRLVQALTQQAREMAHVALAGIVHEPAARLASELVAVAPDGLNRVFFSDDGSTAIEVAVKLAVQYFAQQGQPQRRRFLSLVGAFHGETLGPTALGGVDVFRRPFNQIVMQVDFLPSPADGVEAALEALEQALTARGREYAALVVEPLVQGSAGMRMYPSEFLSRARELTARHGVLLVVDEVFTGYGRTGPMWASSRAPDCRPDILCVGKGFSGGMLPMAATLVTDQLFFGFCGDRSRAFYYGHTFCGNPLGAAVAREVLAVYRDEAILQQGIRKAEPVRLAFESLLGRPGIRTARALGMVAAVELEEPSGYLGSAGWRVYAEALRRGVYLRPLGNVVYICPALTIDDSDLGELLNVVVDVVTEVGASLASP